MLVNAMLIEYNNLDFLCDEIGIPDFSIVNAGGER